MTIKVDSTGGGRGIRTPGTEVKPYDDLANRCLQPLSHPSKSLADIISNSLNAVNEDRRGLPAARIDYHKIGRITLLHLAERIAQPKLDRLVPRRSPDERLEGKTGDIADVLEAHAHPKRGAGKIAALNEASLAIFKLDLEPAHRERVAVLAVRAPERIGDHLHVRKIAARKYELEHIRAEMDLVADDLGVQVFDKEARTHHSDLAMVQRRHLVAEVRQVSEAVLVGRHELGELRARMAAARHDAHLDAVLGELRAALGLGGVGNHLDGIDLRDLLDLGDGGLANVCGILRSAALHVDERPLQMDAGHLGVGHSCLGVLLSVAGGHLKLLGGDRERSGEEGGDALLELRLGQLENRFGIRIAEIVRERAVRMDVDEARHHILPLDVHNRGRALLGNLLRGHVDDLAALDDDGCVLDVHVRRNDVRILDYSLFHLRSPVCFDCETSASRSISLQYTPSRAKIQRTRQVVYAGTH